MGCWRCRARGCWLAGRLPGPTVRVVDRSRRIGKLVRVVSKTRARGIGQRVDQVLALNAKAGQAMACSIREARALAAQARAGQVAVAPEPSCARLASWMTSRTVASGSPPRSSSDRGVSGSATGWCR